MKKCRTPHVSIASKAELHIHEYNSDTTKIWNIATLYAYHEPESVPSAQGI